MNRNALVAALLAALVLAPSVAAHGDGGARGYRSDVTAIEPQVAGLRVQVIGFDDRLLLRNATGETVEILGYDGEPYLRFTADGVFRNERSPATYLNEDRYGKVTVPAEASAKAAPVWTKVEGSPVWEWHDHRIHWMSTIDPPKIRNAPERPQRVFAWTVEGRIEGEPLTIRGVLRYEPPPSGRFTWKLGIPLGLLVVAAVGVWVWRLSRERRAGAATAR